MNFEKIADTSFKGYLHYKTIASQNVSEAQAKNFCPEHIQVFVFLTITWFTKCGTSWRVLAHETRCIFECIF